MPVLPFPIGGLNERGSFERQPRETTPLANDCRPRDPILNRIRGGARPGLAKAFAQQLGGGAPIRMLATIRSAVLSSGTQIFFDDFPGFALTGWTSAPWAGATGVVTGGQYQTDGTTNICAVVRDVLSPAIDPTQDYTVRLLTAAADATQQNSVHRIYARLHDTAASQANSISASVRHNVAGLRTTVELWFGTSTLFSVDVFESYSPGWLELCICAGGMAKVYWRGIQRCSVDISAYPAAGTRVAMELQQLLANPPATRIAGAESFQVEYIRASGGLPVLAAAAVSAGQLYVETQSGSMASIGGSVSLASDHRLQAVDRLGKLYIADWSDPKAQSKTGKGVITSGVLDDTTPINNWDSLGIDIEEDMVEVSSVVGNTLNTRNGTFKISAIDPANGLTLVDPETGATLTGGCTTCNYRVLRGPKVYDSATGVLSLLTPTQLPANSTDSFVPLGHRNIAMWRDRLCFSGDVENPHLAYLSRAGDPTNWQRNQDPSDAVQAIVIQGSALAGGIGEPITMMAGWSDDALFLSSLGKVWAQIGDPAYGGNLVQRSNSVGALPGKPWAIGPESELIWLAPDGVYLMGGPEDKPSPVSPNLLAETLTNIDPTTNEVSLAYDPIGKGILLAITPLTGGVAKHFWINLDPFGFWSVNFDAQHNPYDLVTYDSTVAARRGILIGCKDGYIRRFDPLASDDDGVAVNSEVMIGPIFPGGERDGSISELEIDLAEDSAPVSWDILVGRTAEKALEAQPLASGTMTTENGIERPNVGGSALWLRLRGNLKWGIERISATFERLGFSR